MRRWRVTIPETEIELDADDEGQAIMDATSGMDLVSMARSEEIVPETSAEESQ